MIWYTDVDNEIVDNNSTDEKELIDEINSAIDNAKQLSNLECDNLADNSLENLNKEQLSIFLIKNYFEWWPKTYSQCLATWNFLNFSMKSALQLLYESDSAKFDDNWDPTSDGSGKTINDLIKTRWGIDLDNDSMLIKILQRKVGAHPDWKPGPQTIALVISALGWDVSNIYQWVNDLYKNNEKFRIQNIAEFPIWNRNYKYDQNQFNLTNVDWKIILTVKWEQNWKEVSIVDWKPTLEWFSFENYWIKKWLSNPTSLEADDSNDSGSTSNEVIADGIAIGDNGELLDSEWNNLSNSKTNFVSQLIDRECRRQHWKEWRRSWYNISHSDCCNQMNEWKLSCDDNKETITYKNWDINLVIKRNSSEKFIIEDKSSNPHWNLNIQFSNLSEAINTLKLIEYIKIRFDWVETWANTWNRNWNTCTSNSSPFFIWDKALYFSSDHWSIWGVFGMYDDENIISVDNLKKISKSFYRQEQRIELAKYLVDSVTFDEEH